MTAPGVKPKQFECIDRGSPWGKFFGGAFKNLLKLGYLDEGSKWLAKQTGKKYVIRGKQIQIWTSDEQRQPQTLEEIR